MKIHLMVLMAGFVVFACNRKAGSSVTTSKVEETVSAETSTLPRVSSLNSIPVCIQQKIDSIGKAEVANPPIQVNAYEYEGRKVYLFSAPCCDFFSIAVDNNCKYVCAPFGGFVGKGDGKCEDFPFKAKHLQLVWKDERGKKPK